MDTTRFKVKSPNPSVHAKVGEVVRRAGVVVLENPRRLSISIRQPSPDLLRAIRSTGAEVLQEERYDAEMAAAN